jgi:hypothetical protein
VRRRAGTCAACAGRGCRGGAVSRSWARPKVSSSMISGVGGLFGVDPLVLVVPSHLGRVAQGDVVHVEQDLVFALAVPDLVAGVAGVSEDGADGVLGPGDPAAVPVAVRVVGRRAGDARASRRRKMASAPGGMASGAGGEPGFWLIRLRASRKKNGLPPLSLNRRSTIDSSACSPSTAILRTYSPTCARSSGTTVSVTCPMAAHSAIRSASSR